MQHQKQTKFCMMKTSRKIYALCLAFVMALVPQLGWAQLGKVSSCQHEGAKVSMACEKGTLVVQLYAANGWKVSSLPKGMTLDDERQSVTLTGQYRGCHEIRISETPDRYIIAASNSEVHVDKATALLSFYDNGVFRTSEKLGIDNALATKTISFAPQHDAAFYGGGYNGRFGNLDGQTLTMNNTQCFNWDQRTQGPNNICVPFVVSAKGYGILFEDHYANAHIHVSSSEGISYESLSPTPISYVYVGSEDGSQAGVMKTYGMLTGMHELPPYWALGYITSRYGYHSQEETESVIAALKAENMPVSGLVLDLYWEGEKENGMGNLDWYKPLWPNAKQMLSNLKQQGVHTIIITEPYFAEETTNYKPLLDQGLLADATCPNMEWVSQKKVGIIDFVNPKAIDWMWDFYRNRTDEGVDGWWLDLGEPEMISDGTIHADGSTHAQAHNEFGLHWIAGVWNKWKQQYPNQRPILVPRSGTSGMQRYATFPWTGDIARSWSGLKCQVPALIHGGMSGLGYLSSDIGGFVAQNEKGHYVNPELYLRWFQMGVFTPVLRTHGQYLPEPYQPAYKAYKDRLRELMNLRYRLLPYLYSASWRNTTYGTPITTPLGFYTTENEAANSLDDEYLFGPNMLVAPVMEEGAIGRKVVLPSGQWIDPVEGTAYEGNTTIDFASEDLRMPCFLRCGTFTPFYTQTTFTSANDIDHSALTIYYPMAKERAWDFTLYDDDKTSAQVGNRYELITFSAHAEASQHIIDLGCECAENYDRRPEKRTLSFCVPMCKTPVKCVTSNTLNVRNVEYDAKKALLTFEVDLPSALATTHHEICISF